MIKKKMFNRDNNFINFLCIFVASLITHGLLLINDGVYWDGWLVYNSLLGGDWIILKNLFNEAGIDILVYLHLLMSYFPNLIFGYHLIAFLCIFISAFLIYKIGRISGFLNSTESLWISLISIAYPAFQISFELSIFPYLVCYTLFLFASFLMFLENRKKNKKNVVFKVTSLLCFFISFNLKSLLVFYFGFILLLALTSYPKESKLAKSFFTRFITHHLDYLLLPILFWLTKEFLSPTYGLYSNYNNFHLSFNSLLSNLFYFIKNSIYGQFVASFTVLLAQPVVLFFVLITTSAIIFFIKPSTEKGVTKPVYILLFGLMLLGLGIFPYIIVGKSPSVSGVSTRHAMLVGLPVAIILVASVRLLFKGTIYGFSRKSWFLLTMLFFTFSFAMITNYLNWQVRWVKDRSVMSNLAQIKKAEAFSIFWIDDKYPVEGVDSYRFYEWSSMFEDIWGDEKHIGFDQQSKILMPQTDHEQYYTKRYNLSELDPFGCQSSLTILPGSIDSNDFEITSWYFYFKFFEPQGMREFLSDFTHIKIEYLYSDYATDCNWE